MQSEWPWMVWRSLRCSTSQIRTSPERAGRPPAAASSLPSREKAMERTVPAWPLSAASSCLVAGATSLQTAEQFLESFRITVVVLPVTEIGYVVFANLLGQVYSFVRVERLPHPYVGEGDNADRE